MTAKTESFKASILSPDKVGININYTFTVNPNDEFQYWGDLDRIKKATKHMTFIMNRYINLDISVHLDINRTGRIHWHGTISFKTNAQILDFYVDIIHELLTKHQIEIDTIEDPIKWSDYCHKLDPLIKVLINNVQNRAKKLQQTGVIQYQKPIDSFTE